MSAVALSIVNVWVTHMPGQVFSRSRLPRKAIYVCLDVSTHFTDCRVNSRSNSALFFATKRPTIIPAAKVVKYVGRAIYLGIFFLV